ncbi:hypothetical protein ACFL43_03150 [Thermodesulfobacteriota bacterium]
MLKRINLKYLLPLMTVAALALCLPAYAHVPHIPLSDSSPEDPYYVSSQTAIMGACFTVQDTHPPRGAAQIDVDTVKMVLTAEDFDESLTITGFVDEGGEDTDNGTENTEADDEHDDNQIPLIVTENGVTGRKLYVDTYLAACDTYAETLPIVAIVGPEQEQLPADNGSIALPFTLQEGQGIRIIQNLEQGEIHYEPFTYKSYFKQNSASVILTRPGDYFIHSWIPDNKPGDITLTIGHIEYFGTKELVRSLLLNSWQIYDKDITSEQCVQELEELDGPNPTPREVIEKLYDTFGPHEHEE